MYKHQIKLLVLAAVIGLSVGVQAQAGDKYRNQHNHFFWYGLMSLTLGCFVYQVYKHDVIPNFAKKQRLELDFLEEKRDNVRFDNLGYIQKLDLEKHNDEALKKIGYSPNTRLQVASKRGDINAVVNNLEKEKIESRWSWWSFGPMTLRRLFF